MASSRPPIVGLIANPASSKDIRRLVGLGRVVDVEEKANIAARFLVGLTAGPPIEVAAFDDHAGIARRAVHLARHRAPEVSFLPTPAVGREEDTRRAAAALRSAGAAAVAVIGGDGTVRAVVEGWPTAPLVPVAAGTNNAIGIRHEPTILGAATARAVAEPLRSRAFFQAVRLLAGTDVDQSSALVDVVGVRSPWTGARAIWEPGELVEAMTVNVHPTAIGIAAIAAMFGPLPRDRGRYLRFGPGRTVTVTLGPGMVDTVEVAEVRDYPMGASVPVHAESRLLALDGERRLVAAGARIAIAPGPHLLDVGIALERTGRENEPGPLDTPSSRET
jgi:hypothetical protein